jgi:hypothetical protein
MSWSDFQPAPAPGTAKHPVTLTCTAGRNGCHPRVTISFRPWLMEEPPTWLVPGTMVAARIGHGEHAGKISLVPGGKLELRLNNAGIVRDGRRAIQLVLRGMVIRKDGAALDTDKPIAVECDWQKDQDAGPTCCAVEGWIEVSYPHDQASAPGASAPRRATEPFSMTKGVVSREEMGRRGQGSVG